MIIVDEKGDVEISGEMFMELLADVHKLGMATGVETTYRLMMGRRATDKHLLSRVRRINKQTWEDEEWRKKFVAYIFAFARGEIKGDESL